MIDRNFLPEEFCDSTASKSISDPIRRIKYKLESPEKKKNKWGRAGGDDDDDGGGGGGGDFFWTKLYFFTYNEFMEKMNSQKL